MASEGQIFPKEPGKTYGLMAVVSAETRMADKGPDGTVFSFPLLALLELLLGVGTTLAVLLLSLARNAPLEELANPATTTNPAKAPWYFVGLQEMLEHMHPTLAGVIIPSLLVAFLIVLPYLDQDRTGTGLWFTSRRGRRIAGWKAVYSSLVMPALIALDNVFNVREALRGVAPDILAQWLIPSGVLALVVSAPVVALRLRSRGSNNPPHDDPRVLPRLVHGDARLRSSHDPERLLLPRPWVPPFLAVAHARRLQPIGHPLKDET